MSLFSTLCPHSHTSRENYYGVPNRQALEKNMHLVSIGSTMKSFKLSLTIQSHTYTVSDYFLYLHSLGTITLDLHLTQVVQDCTTYHVLPSFLLK